MGGSSPKVKILIWTTFFYPHVGGYEKNVLELSRRLAARGYQVDIVTCRLDESLFTENIDGVGVIRIPCVKLLKGLYPVPTPSLSLLYLLFNKCEYDITVTQTRFFVLSLIGAVYSVMHKIPLVHVERGSQHSSIVNPIVNMFSRAYDHILGRWIMKRANNVIGVSGAACEFARHLGAKNATIIPNGVVVPELPNISQDLSGTPIILYVGRLIQAKGVQDLIKVLKMPKSSVWKGYSLAIVGDGPYRRKLERLANGKDNIKFYGELIGEELNKMYLFARVFVNPSYSEGLPTAVMEAASLGIPVIATNVGGTGEIIRDGETGILIKPGDVEGLANALYRTLSKPVQAAMMAEKCQAEVRERYSWDIITDKYCKLLDEVHDGKKVTENTDLDREAKIVI